MNYQELSKEPNALDIMNITHTMAGCSHFDSVSRIEGFNRLRSYINNLKTLYPNITEKQLNNIIEEFEADMERQVIAVKSLSQDWVKLVPL